MHDKSRTKELVSKLELWAGDRMKIGDRRQGKVIRVQLSGGRKSQMSKSLVSNLE